MNRTMPTTTWKTKEGQVLDIKDMSTKHLENAVAMVRRKGFITQDQYLRLAAYAFGGDTPEMASYYAEGELSQAKVSMALGPMEDELAARKMS